MRLQIYYAILGLEPSKGIDITIDEKNVRIQNSIVNWTLFGLLDNFLQRMIALRTDVDCKYTKFTQSLSAISLFFKLWHAFTDYKGLEDG